MVCYGGTSDGSIQRPGRWGKLRSVFYLLLTQQHHFGWYSYTSASRGVSLGWIDVSSGVTLWKSEKFTNEFCEEQVCPCIYANGAILHCSQYPSVLCPHCGAVICPQLDASGRIIAIMYVPESAGGAHHFSPHT